MDREIRAPLEERTGSRPWEDFTPSEYVNEKTDSSKAAEIASV